MRNARRILYGTFFVSVLLFEGAFASNPVEKWHITDEQYWCEHQICVAKVIDVRPAPKDEKNVTFSAISWIVNDPGWKVKTEPLWKFRTVNRDPIDHPDLKINDLLVIYISEGELFQIEPLDSNYEESPLVKRLTRIAKMREQAGSDTSFFKDAVFDPDSVVATYALNRLLAPPYLGPDYVAKLRNSAHEKMLLAMCEYEPAN